MVKLLSGNLALCKSLGQLLNFCKLLLILVGWLCYVMFAFFVGHELKIIKVTGFIFDKCCRMCLKTRLVLAYNVVAGVELASPWRRAN